MQLTRPLLAALALFTLFSDAIDNPDNCEDGTSICQSTLYTPSILYIPTLDPQARSMRT
jgi:hypothetical protein